MFVEIISEDRLFKRVMLENRIAKLMGRSGRDNQKIINKLKRKLRQIYSH